MNLRQIKSKIKSITNVGQITKAMQLVSAVKMKKTQDKALQGKPYRQALTETLENILQTDIVSRHPLTKAKNPTSKKLAIVISSNKGLCGVFNFNLFKFINKEIKEFSDYEFIVMGLKAQQFIFHYGGNIIADFSSNTPFENNVTAIYSLVRDRFLKGENSSVELFYNEFISSLVFRAKKKLLLPMQMNFLEKKDRQEFRKEYTIEPEVTVVLSGLFNFYIESEIRGAVQESEAAEHSARMLAMKNATDNSKELVYQLTLLRNSVRQERITNELLDMNTARLAVSA